MKIFWYRGDITKETPKGLLAIVNAANPRLLGGGGVDGCIHRAAGPGLREACHRLPEQAPEIRCYPGEAKTTEGFDLPAQYVIHTVGPIFPAGRGAMFFGEQRLDNAEAETLLAKCIRSSLHEAVHFGVTEIVFPAISCGVYGCYVPVFARIARQVLEEQPLWGNIEEVRFVLFTETELEEFKLGWAGFTEGEESEG